MVKVERAPTRAERNYRTFEENERALSRMNPTPEGPRPSALLTYGPTNGEMLVEAWRERPLRFFATRHDATFLHTDLRLELFDRFVSWAFAPQPTLDPGRPIAADEMADLGLGVWERERVIPPGYGAGPIMIWDQGTFAPMVSESGTDSVAALLALRAGRFDFRVSGRRLNGGFRLERTGGDWRLRKLEDAWASTAHLRSEDRSILTGRTFDDIVADDLLARERPWSPESPTPSLFRDLV